MLANLETLKAKMLSFQNKCLERFGEHHIGYDIASQLLVVVDENQDTLCTFPIIFIGSHCQESNTWIWAWSNENLMESARVLARQFIDLSASLDRNEFTAPLLTFQKDDTGYYPSSIDLPQLLAMSVAHVDALSLERFDFGNTDCYVAVMKPDDDAW